MEYSFEYYGCSVHLCNDIKVQKGWRECTKNPFSQIEYWPRRSVFQLAKQVTSTKLPKSIQENETEKLAYEPINWYKRIQLTKLPNNITINLSILNRHSILPKINHPISPNRYSLIIAIEFYQTGTKEREDSPQLFQRILVKWDHCKALTWNSLKYLFDDQFKFRWCGWKWKI